MSYPKFVCQWDSKKQVSSCYIEYCKDGRCYLACPGCPEHDEQFTYPTHISYQLEVEKGTNILATADVKNEGSTGDVTFEVYDRINNVVLAKKTKEVISNTVELFDVFFTAEKDGEVWFRVKDEYGNIKDKYGPMFLKILRPKFKDPSTNCMLSCVKDGKVVEVIFPGDRKTIYSDYEVYAIADVYNPTSKKYYCGLQVWDWEHNKGYAWCEFDVNPGETKTVKSPKISFQAGSYKLTMILWVLEDSSWVSTDATDVMYVTVKQATTPPIEKPNPKFDYVKYVINGETYYPPFEVEVDKGDEITIEAKIINYGGSGNCFFKVWDGYSKEYIISDSRNVAKNGVVTFSKNIRVNDYLYLIATTGYDNTVTDKSPSANIKLKEETPPPQPPEQPPSKPPSQPSQPSQPTHPSKPTPELPQIPEEIYGIPTWMLVAGGIAVVVGMWMYYEEKKREELMLWSQS